MDPNINEAHLTHEKKNSIKPILTVLLFRNFINVAKINTPQISRNGLVAKVSACGETLNFQNIQERKQIVKASWLL